MLRCAKPSPDWLPAQVGGTSSASTGGHPAKDFRCTTALRPRAHPCDSASRRPPPPDQTVQPWGGRPRIARGGGCSPGRTMSRPPPPPQGPTLSAACASNGICGHSRPHTHEYQISRRLCDRQRNVCLSAIVPIWVLDPCLDTIVDRFGSQNVRKSTNICPNTSGMVGR